MFSLKKSLVHLFFKYFLLFLLEKTRKIDFLVSYIGEKFREFPWKNNPNTVKLTPILVFKIAKKLNFAAYIGEKLRDFLRKFNPNPCLINPKLGLGLGLGGAKIFKLFLLNFESQKWGVI